MCGISGILLGEPQARVDEAVLSAMVESQHHRGPDARGQFVDGPVGLGHNRLSIIDLSELGAQPMHSVGNRASIVFNGEIYNYRELRRELEGRGATFRSKTDTEVILEAWHAFGVDCLKRIEGMFAFALWDHAARTLLVARDRTGIKPLFYAWTGCGLAFASELKAIRLVLSATEVDPVALRQVLLFGCAASPRTLLRGVQKLLPGNAFLVRAGEEPKPFEYWKPSFGPTLTGKPDDLRAELRERLTQAVRRQLVADVPVGAFLSGGLDSSIICSLMQREFPEKVNTFSVGGRGFAESELPYARLMSERLGVRHFPIEIDRRQFLEALPEVAWHNDDPTADPALVPLYYVSKLAREHVTVVLSGEGSDELFAGYAHHASSRARMRQLQKLMRMPGLMRRMALTAIRALRGRERAKDVAQLLEAMEKDPYSVVLRPPAAFENDVRLVTGADLDADKRDYRSSLGGVALVSDDPLEISLRADMRFNLADFLLVRADNMAMAASLEARVPFLDEMVVDFATRLPGDMKLDGERGKAILRDVFNELLPDEIRKRPKAPFPVPLAYWVLGDKHLPMTLLADGALVSAGFLNGPAVVKFLGRCEDYHTVDRWDCTLAWRLMYLEVWARRFIRNEHISLTDAGHRVQPIIS